MTAHPVTSGELRSSKCDRHRGLTLVEILVILVIIGLIGALLLPARRSTRASARRFECITNLKQILRALDEYHITHGHYPPPYTVNAQGKRLHSWRTLLLPYLNRNDLYGQIDFTKPWNNPANAELLKQAIHEFHCPDLPGDPTHTSYVVVLTSDGAFRWGKTTSREEVKDDPTSTLLVVEASGHAVHWMEPADIEESDFLALAQNGATAHRGIVQVGMVAGNADALTPEQIAEFGRAWLTISGGDKTRE